MAPREPQSLSPAPADAITVIAFTANHDAADLTKYRGQFVAWTRDGRTVLAAAPDLADLLQRVSGLRREEYVVDHIG
jgi:hypothetical protein